MMAEQQLVIEPDDVYVSTVLDIREIPTTGVSPGVGGFECEFVEKPPSVLQTECPVCLQILREPYQVTCCGKSYCRICIEELKENDEACPTCNENEINDFPNKGLQQSLYQLKVQCTHQKEGCKWTGELGTLENHLNLDPQPTDILEGCPFSVIECRYHFAGCTTELPRKEMEIHLQEKAQDHLDLLEDKYTVKTQDHKAACSKISSLRNKLSANDNKWLMKIHKYFPTPPAVVMTMKHVGYRRENGNEWFSPPFYTSLRGYKLCLKAVFRKAFGRSCYGGISPPFLSVELCLMKGEFDQELKWPFQKEVEVEVVSQNITEANRKVAINCSTMTFYDLCVRQVTTGDIGAKSNSHIGTQESRQLIKDSDINKFVQDDQIEFRITYVGPVRKTA